MGVFYKNILLFILVFPFFSTTATLEKTIISLEDVLSSADQHYPEIKEILLAVKSSEQDRLSKEGSFDTKLELDGYSRADGYYNGDFIKVSLKKNLPVYGIKVYGGYKVSDGDFPLYEGEMDTLDGGEYSAGFSIPLLRNRDLDMDRLAVLIGSNKVTAKQIELLQRKVAIREQAMHAYWTWIATGRVLTVYQMLYDIAVERQKGLGKKLKKGDIAKIYLSENQQYILKRQAKLYEAENYFKNASRNLSLFIRDKEGKPFVPSLNNLNKSFLFDEAIKPHQFKNLVNGLIKNHPKMKDIDNKLNKFKLLEQGAEAEILPQLDFGFEFRRDTGLGSKSLAGDDQRFMFQFSLPFENRKAKGKLSSAKIMQNSISLKKQLLSEQLSVKLNNLIDTIDASIKVFKNGQEEVLLAEKLEKAEQTRFFQGDSDFFVVNLREQMTAEARIRNIQSALNVNEKKAKLQALIIQQNTSL